MNVIVTGGAGFIGSHLAERLIELGHNVLIIDDLSAGYVENLPDKCQFLDYDICTIGEEWFEGVDAVFSQAASKKNICLKNPFRDLEVNGGGILNLLECCRKAGVKNFIHASTGSVYGEVDGVITEETPTRPVSYYGVSKLAGESYVRMYNKYFNTTVLRYFHVYGTRQESDPKLGGVVSIFKDQITHNKDILIHGDGDQERVFTHVSDIVDANIQSWLNPIAYGKTYNCAASKTVTINNLANMLMKKYGRVGIEYGAPLEGDIYRFHVNSSKISEIGVYFEDFFTDKI